MCTTWTFSEHTSQFLPQTFFQCLLGFSEFFPKLHHLHGALFFVSFSLVISWVTSRTTRTKSAPPMWMDYLGVVRLGVVNKEDTDARAKITSES
jgi:hypothetical protein